MALTIQSGFPVLSSIQSGTTSTTSVAVSAGAGNLLMVVTIAMESSAGNASSVTFNGTALTFIGRAVGTGSFSHAEMWGLINPAVTTANVSVTKASASSNQHQYHIYVLEGADQSTGWRTAATNTATTGTSLSTTVSSVAASDLLLDVISIDNTGHTPTPGADQTATFATQNVGASTNENRGSQQSGANGGVMSWTWTTTAPNSMVANAFIAASATSTSDTPVIPRNSRALILRSTRRF